MGKHLPLTPTQLHYCQRKQFQSFSELRNKWEWGVGASSIPLCPEVSLPIRLYPLRTYLRRGCVIIFRDWQTIKGDCWGRCLSMKRAWFLLKFSPGLHSQTATYVHLFHYFVAGAATVPLCLCMEVFRGPLWSGGKSNPSPIPSPCGGPARRCSHKSFLYLV